LLVGPPWIAALGWPSWWWLGAALSAALALGVWTFLPPDPPRAAHPPGDWRARLGQTLRARGPWMLALAFAVDSAPGRSVVGFLPSIYAQAGISPAWSGLATALAAGINMAGNIGAGRLMQRGVAPQRLLQVGYAAMGGASVLMFVPLWPAGTLAVLGPYAAVLLFSALGGLIPGTLFALAVRVSPGPATVSTTVGWMQQWSALGQFAGPPLVAWVATRAGGWSFSWSVMVLCGAAGLLLARGLGRLHAGRLTAAT
jgi:cyanate permease